MIISTILHAILPHLGDNQAIVMLTPSRVLHDETIQAAPSTRCAWISPSSQRWRGPLSCGWAAPSITWAHGRRWWRRASRRG
eukprot:12884686-Prorocentrum_lima.AAC.1